MTSEIALCHDHWKYRSKISLHAAYRASPLPQIALHRYWNSTFRSLALQRKKKKQPKLSHNVFHVLTSRFIHGGVTRVLDRWIQTLPDVANSQFLFGF
jgi:hypothetical protein